MEITSCWIYYVWTGGNNIKMLLVLCTSFRRVYATNTNTHAGFLFSCLILTKNTQNEYKIKYKKKNKIKTECNSKVRKLSCCFSIQLELYNEARIMQCSLCGMCGLWMFSNKNKNKNKMKKRREKSQ